MRMSVFPSQEMAGIDSDTLIYVYSACLCGFLRSRTYPATSRSSSSRLRWCFQAGAIAGPQ